MRTLVTGGAGFIGSTLVDQLLGLGHRVEVVDDLSTGSLANLERAFAHGEAFAFHELDVRDAALGTLLAASGPEVVFHLAAQASVTVSVADPVGDADVNVLGSLRVIEAARACGARRLVYAASGGTLYGEVDPGDLPVGEDHPRRPGSPYGISKAVVLDYLAATRALHGLEYRALCLANVYGPRQDPHGEAGVVAIFAANLLGGTRSTIFGDGEQTRDFVYVGDVADAFVRAAGAGRAEVMNIGTGEQTSVNELFAVMTGALGGSHAVVHAPARPGELRTSALDPRRARRELGWVASTPLDDGVRRVLVALDGGHAEPELSARLDRA